MPASKTKAKPKPKSKTEEKIIKGEAIEEKTIETRIVKVLPDADQLMRLSDIFSKSGMFPAISNQYEAAAVIEYGRELGIKPIMALQTIVPIKGRLSVESKVLYALALDRGIKVKIVKKDSKGCTLEFSEKGRDPHTTSFTEEDAKRAGLHTKDNFMKYPEEMHFNRCLSKGLRAFDPRIFLGLTTREEAEDFSGSPLAKAPVKKEPEKPEEEKKPQVTFTKGKDQPAEPEPEEEEKSAEEPGTDEATEKEPLVKEIKALLKEAGIDERLFKKWLGEELQPSKPDREFVGLKFNNYSLTEGRIEDLKLLKENIEWAMNEYLESDTFKEEARKEEPDEEKKEDPL